MLKITDDTQPPLRHPWRNCITVGRAYDLMRADLRKHLEDAQREIGWKYIRFHALFHDDMDVVRRDLKSGKLRFQWHHIDKVFDFLLQIGLRPFVELNPMPSTLASGDQLMFKYQMNVTPPKDWLEWESLVHEFTRHCVERYGLEMVRTWYFEVWNEPNLKGFWSGSQDDYWLLYRHAAQGVKAVHEDLRIGGPATAGAGWIQEFLDYCANESVPVDFVSTHRYPQDEYCLYPDRKGSPHQAGAFFSDEVKRVRQVVANSSRPDLEIHWTEWNSQSSLPGQPVTWSDNPFVDRCFAASFIARHCLELDDACDSLAWWVLSDIFEEGVIPGAPFSCTYGLVTIHDFPKASYNAFALLSRLRGERVNALLPEGPPDGCGAVATRDNQTWRILLYNHPPLEKDQSPAWKDAIEIPLPVDDRTHVFTTRIAPGAGSAWETWNALGRPHNVTQTEMDLLRYQALPERKAEPADRFTAGTGLTIPFELEPYTVLMIEIKTVDALTWGEGAGESTADLDEKLHTGDLK